MGIIVGIVGSRKYPNESLVEHHVHIFRTLGFYFGGLTIISGGCEGVDSWAIEYAEEVGIPTGEYLPNTYDREGFFARNKTIAEKADLIVAFIPAGQYRSGAWNTVKWARQYGKPYIVLDEDGNKWDRKLGD